MANLASMLPSVPKSVRRLSEVYLSALEAISGQPNSLELPNRSSYVVVLIDGLGSDNIRSNQAYARNIAAKAATSKTLFCGFPSTTASSLASLATGRESGEHAFIGYRVFDRTANRTVNLLNDLAPEQDSRLYQPLKTVSEFAIEKGFRVQTIGKADYQFSGLTAATMPGAKYIVADSIADRFSVTAKELRTASTLIYLYIPELDQIGHRFGTNSSMWLEQLEEIDSELGKFLKQLPKSAGMVLTADHGMIDIPTTQQIYLDELEAFDDLVMLGGDPRVGFLYFQSGVDLKLKQSEIETKLSGLCQLVTFEELVDKGWFAQLSEAANRFRPDLVLLANSNRTIYHRKFAKPKSLEMIGQHGGMTKPEWEVPLLVW